LIYLLTRWTDPVHRQIFTFAEKHMALTTLLRIFHQQSASQISRDILTIVRECSRLNVVTRLFPSTSFLFLLDDRLLGRLAEHVHGRLALLAGIGERADLFQVVREAFASPPLTDSALPPSFAITLFDPEDPTNDVPLYNCVTSRNLSQFLDQGKRDTERPLLPFEVLVPANAPSWPKAAEVVPGVNFVNPFSITSQNFYDVGAL
jgi:hypothetical protein